MRTRLTPRLVPLALGALLVAGFQPPAAAVEPVAKLVAVMGTVKWRPPAGAWADARANVDLAAGTVVRTGSRGMARLRFKNGGEFRLNAMTELTVTDSDALDVSVGQVWARFKEKLTAPFRFRSPSATAVVRGTTLTFGVDPKGGTRVDVEEGRVEVSGKGGAPAMVGAGQTVKVTPGGAVGKPLPTSQAGDPNDPDCDP